MGRIPADFDGDWYAATYMDVALSGLAPSDHYRMFGILFGRPAKAPPPPPEAERQPEPQPEREAAPASAREPEREVVPQAPLPPEAPPKPHEQQPKPAKKAAIVDRPKDFDAAASVPEPAPPRTGGGSDGCFTLEALARLPAGADASGVLPALRGYAKLLNLKAPSGPAEGHAAASCGAMAFQAGGTRIENAWFAAPSRLRLLIAGPSADDPSSAGCAIRAYQARPASAGELRAVGGGVRIPSRGPVLHDLELLHPLMPLLLELADAEGVTRAFALVPFPSLLPGGLHGAELKAQQTEPNPIDDFWALSEALLQEALGGEGWPKRSIGAISVAGHGEAEKGPLFTAAMQEWLACVFGVSLDAPDAAKARRGSRKGLRLLLPPNSVPTVGALVSRRLDAGVEGSRTGAYLIAEAESFRPRWSVALPADLRDPGAAPALVGAKAEAADASLAPIPLAIAIRSPAALPAHKPQLGGGARPRPDNTRSLTVLVDASSPDRLDRLLKAIGSVSRGEVELLVRAARPDADLRSAITRACEQGARSVAADGDLRAIAIGARRETLLTVSDRVELDNSEALDAIVDLLLEDEKSASASCALLAEKIVKKDVVLQPASGGLFPTGVSFVSGPRLAFGEPNALDALPELTYPVVANTLLFTAWRRDALAQLPAAPATALAAAEDVRIGLALMQAGYRNICTTRCTARLSGPYAPRDGVDPVGPGFLQLQAWEGILGRVTVVRELF